MKNISLAHKNKFSFISKSLAGLVSIIFILVLVFIALFAPIIANDKPIYLNYHGTIFYPALSGDEHAIIKDESTGTDIKLVFNEFRFNTNSDVSVIMPLIPYSPNASDIMNSGYKSPSSNQQAKIDSEIISLTGLNKHLLGTGKRGEDVLAGLIYGTRVSLTVGLFAMLIAGLLGIIMGSLAGYYGDNYLKIERGQSIMLLLGILPAWFYAFQLRSFTLIDSLQLSPFSFVLQLLISIFLFITILILFFYLAKLFSPIKFFNKPINFPVDSLVTRCIEILISLPRLILILTIAAIARPSLVNLVLIIGLTSWTEIARLTRAEMLKVRNQEFIESARSLGFKEFRIIFKHAVPNAIGPALVAIAFGIAASILTESALSFLGIGVPQNMVTWGSLLAAGRENYNAWWLVVFPGIAIFATVTAYNLIGESIRNFMDPKGG